MLENNDRKVLCVGQLVADILVKEVGKFEPLSDTVRVNQIKIKSGGDNLNTALALGKLGARVAAVGSVGDDILGEHLKKTLTENEVDIEGIYVTRDHETSSVIVLVDETGDRSFLYYGGANDYFEYSMIPISKLSQATIVHVGGAFLLPKFDGHGALQLFNAAHKAGSLTSMDVTWDTSGRWMEIIKPCLHELDLFMPSIAEARMITGKSDVIDIVSYLKNAGVRHVIIKLGERGSYTDAFGRAFFTPAYKVPIVDTTGAGDTFVAGVLFGLSRDWDIVRTVEFATGVSALNIQKLGATEGVPDYKTVQDFINCHDERVV